MAVTQYFSRQRNPAEVFSGVRSWIETGKGSIFPDSSVKPAGVSLEGIENTCSILIRTSGSTSRPKIVWITRDALIAGAQQSSKHDSNGTWWAALPPHYIAGLQVITRSVLAGTSPIFASEGDVVESFANDYRSLQEAKDRGNLYTSLVPTQLHQLLEASEHDSRLAHTLRLFDQILVGGQRVPRELRSRAIAQGLTVVRTYGSTETSGGCVWDGVPLDGVTLTTMEGRVAIAGPMLAGGYVGDPEKSEATFREIDGTRWFISDDRGEVLDGKLVIHGRVDEVMVSGGLKVDLAEVERFLSGIGLSGHVAVVSRPDARWGEVPVVVSTAELDQEETASMLIRHFGKGLSKVEFSRISDMPRTDSGKVSKRVLREMLASGTNYPGAL